MQPNTLPTESVQLGASGDVRRYPIWTADFRNWWNADGKARFHRRRDLAAQLSCTQASVETWFMGLSFPSKKQCLQLERLSGLQWFSAKGVRARTMGEHFRRLETEWAKSLLLQLDKYIEKGGWSNRSKESLRSGIYPLLRRAEKQGFAAPSNITPEWTAAHGIERREGNEPADKLRSAITEALARAAFGRFLVDAAHWQATQEQILRDLLPRFWPEWGKRSSAAQTPRQNSSSDAATRALARDLAGRCGLAVHEILALRVEQLEERGIRVGPHKFIVFGDGWHCVSKEAVGQYISEYEPKDFLFYKRAPRERSKAMGRGTLARAARGRDGSTLLSLRQEHFRKEIEAASSLSQLRMHLRNVHGLSNVHASQMIRWSVCEAAQLTNTLRQRVARKYLGRLPVNWFVVPKPFLLAALCASRIVPAEAKILKGGKRMQSVWDLLNRYRVTVSWPARFAGSLGHAKKREMVARLLYALAAEYWQDRARLRPSKLAGKQFKFRDRELMKRLALVKVAVEDRSMGAAWAGCLLEVRSHGRAFRIPLMEEMEGGAYRCRCRVCMDPQRRAIDRKIRSALGTSGRVRGLKSIAAEFSVSYNSLLRHAGRLGPVLGRGEVRRSHVGARQRAESVRCRRLFVETIGRLRATDIVLYVCQLLTGASLDGVAEARECLRLFGLEQTQSEVSVAMNRLANTKLISHWA